MAFELEEECWVMFKNMPCRMFVVGRYDRACAKMKNIVPDDPTSGVKLIRSTNTLYDLHLELPNNSINVIGNAALMKDVNEQDIYGTPEDLANALHMKITKEVQRAGWSTREIT